MRAAFKTITIIILLVSVLCEHCVIDNTRILWWRLLSKSEALPVGLKIVKYLKNFVLWKKCYGFN